MEPRKFGLNQVYPAQSDTPSSIDIDIIAIHGLDTHSPKTWVAWKEDGNPASGDVHWLQDSDMLPSIIPNARIFTYDWNASFDHNPATDILLGHADGLLDRLHIQRLKDGSKSPIIFIASCFGGLLLVKALHRALEVREYQGILRLTIGIAFLGTPFQGSHEGFYNATQLRVAIATYMGGKPSNDLIKYLRNDADGRAELDELIERFREMVENDEFKIPMVCFYENQPTDFTKVVKYLSPEFIKCLDNDHYGILVPRASACLQGPRRFGLDVRHAMLSKYAGPEDDAFQRVSFRLKEFVDSAQKILKAKGSNKGHFLMPLGRNEAFVGRSTLLSSLLDRLPPAAHPNDCQRTALEGLGGTGKTQIALEVAYRIHETYPDCSVFWVPAVNSASLSNAYLNIGQALGVKGLEEDKADVFALVHAALARDDVGPWLWIIDNADDQELLFGGQGILQLPFNRNGSILITTRTREVAIQLDIYPPNLYTVEAMSRPESTELLTQGLMQDQLHDTTSTDRLLDFLIDLPLAIKQASAYIVMKRISTARYLVLCQSSDGNLIKLLSRDFDDRGRYKDIQNPIITTWLISFEHIARDMPVAAGYLKFISFLSEKNIPRALLPGNDALEVDDALGTLKSYAFINERVDTGWFDIHRLVRLSMLNLLAERGEQGEWRSRVMQRLNDIYDPPEHENKPAWISYLPHAQAALKTSVEATEDDDNITESHLLCKVGHSSFVLGQYGEAEASQRKALNLRTRKLGARHADTLDSATRLALALAEQGQWSEAEAMDRKTLELRTQVLGTRHPDTLSSMSHLANVLEQQANYADAEALHRQTLELRTEELGETHPQTIESMNCLAVALDGQGHYAQTEVIYRQTLGLRARVLGPAHPHTLESMNDLGLILTWRGQFAEAESMHRQMLDLASEALGAEHPTTLASMINIAIAQDGRGRHASASALFRKTLTLHRRVLGAEHPTTLIIMNNLGGALKRRGHYVEAEAIHQQTLQLRIKVLGPKHPHTLFSMNGLASTLHSEGRFAEAEALHRQTLQIRTEELGPEHPDTLHSLNELGRTLCSQGQYHEGEETHRRALALRTKALGAEYPDTLASMNDLACVLHSQGSHAEAGELYQRTLELRTKVLGMEHPDTLSSAELLAALR